jgi:hypothetical protein
MKKKARGDNFFHSETSHYLLFSQPSFYALTLKIPNGKEVPASSCFSIL